jgi:exodeoxyribonuclease V alpha subunit
MRQQKKASGELTTIRGTVDRVTYRNPENDYGVLRFSVDYPAREGFVAIVGYGLNYSEGTKLTVTGTRSVHAKFGIQYEVQSAVEVVPETEAEILRYLASGMITGIGLATAKKIVACFGTDTLKVLREETHKLSKVPGLGKRKIDTIKDAIAQKNQSMEVESFFVKHNIGGALLRKILEHYGENAVKIIKLDPYALALDIKGVGFTTADSIAQSLGIESDSLQRLRAGLHQTLESARDNGHLYLTEKQLAEQARDLMNLDPSVALEEAMGSLIQQQLIVEDDSGETLNYYLKRYYDAEYFVARFISERSLPLSSPSVPAERIDSSLNSAEESLGIIFSPEQRHAVHKACAHSLLLLTGGPGCGKTTVVKAIVATYLAAGKVVALAAPTGKAAQRMSEVCSHPAQTIHRLLKYNPQKRGFTYGAHNPLQVSLDGDDSSLVDVLIIDESSMIDVSLAKSLFLALPSTTSLILVGDQDQLPSVGPGRVFGDLLSVKELPAISLNQLFRRSEQSRITSIAHLVNAGLDPNIPIPQNRSADAPAESDAYFIERNTPEEAAALIEKLVQDQVPKKFNIELEKIQVLTPTNKGPLGTLELNARIQKAVNPRYDENEILRFGDSLFAVGDRVCQRVNNYQLDQYGVFNGDLGTIIEVDPITFSLRVELWDGRVIHYSKKNISELSLSYAMTIHRSQGSEMPCCIIALHESHFILLERQLLYTGITRAKQLLLVVGSKRALTLGYQRAMSRKRNTALVRRVQTILDNGMYF